MTVIESSGLYLFIVAFNNTDDFSSVLEMHDVHAIPESFTFREFSGINNDTIDRADHLALFASDTIFSAVIKLPAIPFWNLPDVSFLFKVVFIRVLMRDVRFKELPDCHPHPDENSINASVDVSYVFVHILILPCGGTTDAFDFHGIP